VSGASTGIAVRGTRRDDIPEIIELCKAVYPGAQPWREEQLASHLDVFPEGQFVAVATGGAVVGMAASLIVRWDDYEMSSSWRDFTDHGTFANHDPENGRTLYGAEIMVHPEGQGRGIGTLLYEHRRALTERLALRRIRAGARLRGYHRHAARMSAEDYAIAVARGEIWDPTVSFQLKRGFHILAVVQGYLRHDPESLGYAAVIEWVNHRVARLEDEAGRDPRFGPAPPQP
jgi:GNAT superfamily N-acetyltransferase